MNRYPCPACGFLVFDEPTGCFAICDVCDWKDDYVQLAYPMMGGGANRSSLLEHQRELLTRIPPHTTVYNGFIRDASWRPLTEQDCITDTPVPETGLDYFHAAAAVSPTYYWQHQPTQENE